MNLTNKGVKIGNVCINILLYADDLVLLSETEEDLQCMLNILDKWCRKWRMVINMEKTQIIHFRYKQKPQTSFIFYLGSRPISIVTKYRYLGCTINKFWYKHTIGDALAEGASRALGKVPAKYYKNKGLGYKTYTKLYESCVCPIMDYCVSVWGHAKNDKIMKIHTRAMRCFLGVNKYAPIAGIEGDMGWITPDVRHKLAILRYWNKIVDMTDTRIPKIIFNYLRGNNEGWAKQTYDIFAQINCKDLFTNNVKILNLREFLTKTSNVSTHCNMEKRHCTEVKT